ncbi:isochorismate synthase [Methylomonas sp. EFPC3]|uniref:isochorismate synthase n=1 Tax=Methylomonas sp. EFPC3 TaxID=3021710 RepID=UPI002415E98C|nr:isochorismate synthase [Methylomonas sp. EFPC3]WFP50546.1 isochorismate synthase [Methylomonas sp. EFPC3]
MFTDTQHATPSSNAALTEAGVTPDAGTLLSRFGTASSFFMATPELTLHGIGVRDQLHTGADQSMEDALQRLFALNREHGDASSIAVGALPFAADAPAVLFIPERLELAGRLERRGAPPAGPAVGGAATQERPSRERYAQGVAQALGMMRQSGLKKVVLSRMLEVVGEHDIDQARLLRNLAANNLSGYTFALNLQSETRSIRRLIGASPELLLRRRGINLEANPIAGTAPRSRDPGEDLSHSRRLLHSAKDRHEHALVVEAVADALGPFCSALEVPPIPELIATARVWHLSTRIRGVLRDRESSSLTLARALHPTPAVCGEPRELARQAIARLECFDRGLFTGLVGWCAANGDGEWAVTIRCAEIEANRANLYAGAGIVPDSQPWQEVDETSAKFRTLLDALHGSRP